MIIYKDRGVSPSIYKPGASIRTSTKVPEIQVLIKSTIVAPPNVVKETPPSNYDFRLRPLYHERHYDFIKNKPLKDLFNPSVI